jgi:hypothetical protein
MLKFANRGFGRALMTRSTGQGAVANAEATTTAAAKGETSVLEDNIWFVNSTTNESRIVGFRWTPGLWARAKVESAETNKALIQRIKTFDVTPRDLFNLSGVGLSMWAAFLVGSMIGKWKIFGYRLQEPHHGHGFWTDAPAKH